MKKKLNCIMLIDDEPTTNFYNTLVIEDAHCTEHIQVCESGPEALDYLKKPQAGGYCNPAIVFLDINMPEMSGWEFLDLYDKLPPEQKAQVIIVMLTTSLNPDDQVKAKERGVEKFTSKPLTTAILMDIIKRKFPDHL